MLHKLHLVLNRQPCTRWLIGTCGQLPSDSFHSQAESQLRALKSFKNLFRGLTTKRFMVETPKPVPGAPLQMVNMHAMTQAINQERLTFKSKLQETFSPLQVLCLQHSEAFRTASGDWNMHGLFAKGAINAICELLPLITPQDSLPQGTQPLLEEIHSCSGAVMQQQPSPSTSGIATLPKRPITRGNLQAALYLTVRFHPLRPPVLPTFIHLLLFGITTIPVDYNAISEHINFFQVLKLKAEEISWCRSLLIRLVLSVIATFSSPGAPPLAPAQLPAWQSLGSRLFEVMARSVISFLEHFPIPFAAYVPYFLTLYAQNAVIGLDAETIRNMRPKLRVLLARLAANPSFSKALALTVLD